MTDVAVKTADEILEESTGSHWFCCRLDVVVSFCGVLTTEDGNPGIVDDMPSDCIVCNDIWKSSRKNHCPVFSTSCSKVLGDPSLLFR